MSDLPLVWIDLEMSGLEVENCTILEIATVITNGQLEVIEEGPNLVIHQPDSVLDAMDEWNTEHHGASGLTAAVKASTVEMAEAERQSLEFIRKHVDKGASPLCGNSVGNDRNFLAKYMPELLAHLHYRVVDVSSVKEIARRWYGDDIIPPKKGGHRALDDIRESIEELKHYRARLCLEAARDAE